jgi:hypothetical protein
VRGTRRESVSDLLCGDGPSPHPLRASPRSSRPREARGGGD